MKDDFEYAVLNSESHTRWFSTELVCIVAIVNRIKAHISSKL